LGEFGIYKERSSGRVFGRAPVEFLVELRWNVRWSSGRISGGASVDVGTRGLSEDPLRSRAMVG
jgi:hypothetical protein